MLTWKVLFIIFKGRSVTRNCLRPQSLPLRVCFFKKPLNRSSHRRCSVKKVFLEISQNSQENTCARVSFWITLQASSPSSRHSDVFLKFSLSSKKGVRSNALRDATFDVLLKYYQNIQIRFCKERTTSSMCSAKLKNAKSYHQMRLTDFCTQFHCFQSLIWFLETRHLRIQDKKRMQWCTLQQCCKVHHRRCLRASWMWVCHLFG